MSTSYLSVFILSCIHCTIIPYPHTPMYYHLGLLADRVIYGLRGGGKTGWRYRLPTLFSPCLSLALYFSRSLCLSFSLLLSAVISLKCLICLFAAHSHQHLRVLTVYNYRLGHLYIYGKFTFKFLKCFLSLRQAPQLGNVIH